MEYFYVYILKCRDGSYYVGHTDDIDKRANEHQAGICDGYTVKRRPVQVVFLQTLATRDEAFVAERQIKGWSRKKKEALIRGDWKKISRLAKKRFNDPSIQFASQITQDERGEKNTRRLVA